jgi:tryptophan synthase alpha chain
MPEPAPAAASSASRPGAATTDRIGDAFAAAREQGRAALMPYMMGGFPDAASARRVARAYADGGADLIELGIPFSDPLADGPVIHAAATAALEAGATLDTALEACAEVAADLPVVAMGYVNMILATGEAEFAGRLADAGAAGAIVPDLPLGEGEGIREAFASAGLSLVPLVAPTTSEQRRREICAGAQGFVYVVSTVGVTGERKGLPPELAELVAAAKRESQVPVAVGFGISTPEQVAAVGADADGVIVGSRLVREVQDAPDTEAAAAAVTGFLNEAREALAGT